MFVHWSAAFTPLALSRTSVTTPSSTQRHVHVATDFLLSTIQDDEAAGAGSDDSSGNPLAVTQESLNSMSTANTDNNSQSAKPSRRRKTKLPRSERKALERQKKARKKQQQPPKKTNSFKLHSNAVSQLTSQSSADDVVRAIKRAQKQHDHHDLRVIAKFLIEECDVGFAYGYRGSLLARLAVAALRWENHAVARKAIEIRRLEYRASMAPMESAAIIRGLLRTHNVTDALAILQDELSLPLEVCLAF